MLPYRENIVEDVWQRLPATKSLLGRARVRKLTESAVRAWPMYQLGECQSEDEREQLVKDYARKLARQEYGSIMVILMIGLVTALVRVILEWWLLSSSDRVKITRWSTEL
jgi:hypothetical protein